MANHQLRQNQGFLGYLAISPSNGSAALNLNAAATWMSFGFVPEFGASTKQVSKVRIRLSGVTGTLGATDLSCDLCADSSGVPNSGSPIESRNTVTATPTGVGWVEFTGFTATSTITRGVRYHFVIKNGNGTPASNYPTVAWYSANTGPFPATAISSWGWSKVHTVDSGTNWTSTLQQNVSGGVRIEYSDGSFEGFPLTTITNTGSAVGVYAAREYGVEFTTPANATVNAIGALFFMSKVGTPTNGVRCRLYTGGTPSLQATSDVIPVANIGTSAAWVKFTFSSAISITGGTVVTLVMGTSSGGDSSNYFRGYYAGIDNDADDKALMPFGAYRAAYLDSTWSYDDTVCLFGGLILDTSGEYTASGSGGPVSGNIRGGFIN